MLARLLALLAVLALLAPTAAAFSATKGDVRIDFPVGGAPVMLATGKLDATGQLTSGLFVVSVTDARFGPVATLSIARSGGAGTLPSLENVSDATLVVHQGHVFWKLDNATAKLDASSAYGFGLALPNSPFDQGGDNATRSPALVMAAPALTATVSWPGGAATLAPIQATVSVLDRTGKPVQGWDHQVVNPTGDLGSAKQEGSDAVAFQATGAFTATLPAQGLAAGLDAHASGMRLGVTRSDQDKFIEAADAVTNATKLFQGQGGGQGQGPDLGNAFGAIQGISGIFNGAVLLVPNGGGDNASGQSSGRPTPTDATLGGQALDVGPFAFLRSDTLALAWGDGTVGVQGASKATVTQAGFAVSPPLVVGYVPLLSALLWLGAIGAIVWFFVKRPPASKGKWSLRGISWGVYVLVLLIVFLYWDASFADTFGTSLVTQLRAHGISDYTQLALVFGLEMVPWSLAALLFALPVRIMAGVALRYRGEGSSFKGVAKAGGLVALALLGPLYALWIVNVMLKGILAVAPKLLGGGG